MLAYHVALTALLGLKIQKNSKSFEEFGAPFIAHAVLCFLFVVGLIFTRDASSQKNKFE